MRRPSGATQNWTEGAGAPAGGAGLKYPVVEGDPRLGSHQSALRPFDGLDRARHQDERSLADHLWGRRAEDPHAGSAPFGPGAVWSVAVLGLGTWAVQPGEQRR